MAATPTSRVERLRTLSVGKGPRHHRDLVGHPAVTGQPLTFTATVGAVAPATGTPSGTVTFAFSDPVPTKGPGHLVTPSCGNGGTRPTPSP